MTGLVAAAVIGSTTIAGLVPSSGLLEWRSRSGLGGGIYGGVSYNLFVSTVQSDLLSLGDEPVFVAQVADRSTHDRCIGSSSVWSLTTARTGFPKTNRSPARTVTWATDLKILITKAAPSRSPSRANPNTPYELPAGAAGVKALSSENDLLDESFAVRDDGSIRFDAEHLKV